MFQWMPIDMASSREALRAWVATALAAALAGREVPYTILAADSGRVLGSTRFLELRLEHLRAEIGWTWVTREAWGTGVNVEAKLLLLEHAFERVGTAARGVQDRRAQRALAGGPARPSGPSSRGSCASTWWSATAVRGTRRTTR